jgi:hypothetical protein
VLLYLFHRWAGCFSGRVIGSDDVQNHRGVRLANAAELVATAVEETLAYYDFLREDWRRIRTTDVFDKRVFWVGS